MRTSPVLVIFLGAFLCAGTAHAAVDAAIACKEKKAKATGKKASDLMKAFGKNIKKPYPAKLAADVSKAESKYSKAFEKVESTGGCQTTGDAAAIEDKVNALVIETIASLPPVCGDGVVAGNEDCDGADDASCPGICQPNCRCPQPAICGNGSVEAGEVCDPPCAQGPCGVGEICGITCQCEPVAPCDCGTPDPPTLLEFSMEDQDGICGTIENGSGVLLDLQCATSYLGGGLLGSFTQLDTPAPLGTNLHNVECCYGTKLALTTTTEADTGSNLTCTQGPRCSAGSSNPGASCLRDSQCPGGACDVCFFGSPIPVLTNPLGLSVCTVDQVFKSASGSADCSTGEAAIDIPIFSDVYLIGDILPKRCDGGSEPGRKCSVDSDCPGGGACLADPDTQPCPICNPVTNTCNGGPNNNLPCTPGVLQPGPQFPTSQDCPPPSAQLISTTFMPYPLRTGTTTLEADDGQFCGFCRDVEIEGSNCWEGDPDLSSGPGGQNCPDSAVIPDCQPQSYHDPELSGSISGCGTPIPCASDADCYAPYETCEQRNPGAFGKPTATFGTISGVPAGDFRDRAQHDVTMAGLYCTGLTFSIADPNGGLPGPGAVSLPGKFKLLPGPPTTTSTSSTTTSTTTTTT